MKPLVLVHSGTFDLTLCFGICSSLCQECSALFTPPLTNGVTEIPLSALSLNFTFSLPTRIFSCCLFDFPEVGTPLKRRHCSKNSSPQITYHCALWACSCPWFSHWAEGRAISCLPSTRHDHSRLRFGKRNTN